MDNLPCGEHRSGMGVCLRDATVRHFAGELSFLHFSGDVADQFVHYHDVGG